MQARMSKTDATDRRPQPIRFFRKPGSKKQKRSQAERTAETRARILAGALESVHEVGYERTTASEITRRAGVTWGAVAHHFGDKDSLLFAVVEHCSELFITRLGSVSADLPLGQRIDQFVDRAWEHFKGSEHSVAMEVILNLRRREDVTDDWRQDALQAFTALWMRTFGDVEMSDEDRLALEIFINGFFLGLGMSESLDPEEQVDFRVLEIAKKTLRRELGVPDSQKARS